MASSSGFDRSKTPDSVIVFIGIILFLYLVSSWNKVHKLEEEIAYLTYCKEELIDEFESYKDWHANDYDLGYDDGYLDGHADGSAEGYEGGLIEGKESGYNAGYEQGYQDAISGY